MAKSFVSNIINISIEMLILIISLICAHDYNVLRIGIILCLVAQMVHMLFLLFAMGRVRKGFASNNLEAIAETFPAAAALIKASYVDRLTQCFTRPHFEAVRGKYEKQSHLFIAFFDVNNLKYVNDTYGHEIGDKLLMEMGSTLCELNELGDIFRWGGDEFLFISTEKSDEDINDIRAKVETWYENSLANKKIINVDGIQIPG